MINVENLRSRTLAFIQRQHLPQNGIGAYRYSASAKKPTLYSSTYAAKTRSLYNDLGGLSDSERKEWIDYLNRHQDDDGLFRDPVIFDEGWYAEDPFWCGRPHLTGQVLGALACLGGVAQREINLVRQFSDADTLMSWLRSRDWGERVAWCGNEVLNLGRILQYARDFHNDQKAGVAVEILLDWMDSHHVNPDTGLWGELEIGRDPLLLSHAVQAAYHFWLLYFYDCRPIPHIERAVDSVLKTQNPEGGFGLGVHNPDYPYKSSACEDIDSIDPLVRMSFCTGYRREDVRSALERALPWLLRNQVADGGFVFMLDRPFEYGHPELHGEKDEGAMFPTWFRTLTIALIGKGLPESPAGTYLWNFSNCPGPQFWKNPVHPEEK